MKNFFTILLITISLTSCKHELNSKQEILPEKYTFINQSGYVNDYDEILSIEEENSLEELFTNFDNLTENETGVVTVKSISPYSDINKMADGILQDWRFGKDDKFNGLIFLIDKKGRQISVRFGKGIQEKITDKETREIIDEHITPHFFLGKYYLGILAGFNQIQKELK